ncbi:hypothetical protein NDU88_007898 [Pleurodeles waltl]|uniref:Uncharacterized protein n=1 Tax=Pleurodeles waltl TaxID=8319 RepID=A0AAV7P248_PLEWA|nr:hypothetical protein NDU88_007898 [Pleurodeles waltl]
MAPLPRSSLRPTALPQVFTAPQAARCRCTPGQHWHAVPPPARRPSHPALHAPLLCDVGPQDCERRFWCVGETQRSRAVAAPLLLAPRLAPNAE